MLQNIKMDKKYILLLSIQSILTNKSSEICSRGVLDNNLKWFSFQGNNNGLG